MVNINLQLSVHVQEVVEFHDKHCASSQLIYRFSVVGHVASVSPCNSTRAHVGECSPYTNRRCVRALLTAENA